MLSASLNDHEAVVAFIDGDLDNGLESVLLEYNAQKDSLQIGPYLDLQDGGASGQSESGSYNFIHLRVMSESRFAVFYSNVINNGATALVMAEVTPAKDLVPVGPEYLVSSPMMDPVRLAALARAVVDAVLLAGGVRAAHQPAAAHRGSDRIGRRYGA